ncbi:nitronate monooxygenase [Paenibacillus sp. JNUCC31]|nr:nitronate monooxygenase [Paenibacillus sp. JNUCC-31]
MNAIVTHKAIYFLIRAKANIQSLVLVSSRRQAQKAEQLGASAVIVVRNEGGGHIGRDDVRTMMIVPQVVDTVESPRFGDGRRWVVAYALGAEVIEMGTRFIATQECVDASTYKKMNNVIMFN